MNATNTKNAFLLTASTALVTIGVTNFVADLLLGVVAIVVGAGLFLLYEYLP